MSLTITSVISRGVQVIPSSLAQGGLVLSQAAKWTAISDGTWILPDGSYRLE